MWSTQPGPRLGAHRSGVSGTRCRAGRGRSADSAAATTPSSTARPYRNRAQIISGMTMDPFTGTDEVEGRRDVRAVPEETGASPGPRTPRRQLSDRLRAGRRSGKGERSPGRPGDFAAHDVRPEPSSSLTSASWKRRCPPGVFVASRRPSRTQRLTVVGCTRSFRATSRAVRRVSGCVMHRTLRVPLLLCQAQDAAFSWLGLR